MRFFGWTVTRDDEDIEREQRIKSITPEPNDGSALVDVTGLSDPASIDGRYGDAYSYSMSFDIDPTIISEQQLIGKYREIALDDNIEPAIDDIINEMAVTDAAEIVTIDLDGLTYSVNLKNKIREEFDHILNLLDFNNNGFEILKRWYVDGRMHYQVIVDEKKYTEEGIAKLTYIDPRLIKKVKVVQRDKDTRTGADLYLDRDYFYMFSETGFGSNLNVPMNQTETGVKLSKDSVVQITSGLMNPTNTVILSFLHKAIRPLNQLKSLEDAAIIYRLSRAPERRIFYIDVGNLPPAKAEQVLKRQMQQYRSKMVYDTKSGAMRSDPKTMVMTEDYFLPRRSDGKATEITTLPGGQNLGEMNEIEYFLNKLYKSLNVPISRMDPQAGFNFGRVTEINRDEIKFMKFIGRLRKKFSMLFLELLKRQLALKNILNPEEFENIAHNISFDYNTDSIFEEAKNTEIMNGRLDLLTKVKEYRGTFYSDEWIKREILMQSQEEIEDLAIQMDQEREAGNYDDMLQDQDNGQDSMELDSQFKPSPDMLDVVPSPKEETQSNEVEKIVKPLKR